MPRIVAGGFNRVRLSAWPRAPMTIGQTRRRHSLSGPGFTSIGMSWNERHVLIMGGTSGIGRATVIRLAQRGARVTFVGRDTSRGRFVEDAVRAQGGEAYFLPIDLTEPGAAEAAVRQADEMAPIDAAVNAVAPRIEDRKPLVEATDDEFEAGFVSGARLHFSCLRAEVNAARRRASRLSIVNISVVNEVGSSPPTPLYSAMKAAILTFTKSCALDYEPDGIRVNTLVVGAIDTPMLVNGYRSVTNGDPLVVDGMRQPFAEMIPLRRLGRSDEAAAAADWLCSEESAHVNGASIIVDGGQTSFNVNSFFRMAISPS